MYKDDNISVFALPVVPSNIPSPVMNSLGETLAGSLKRKREDSLEPSPKQFSSQHSAAPRAGDIITTTETLRKAASAPDFDPFSLRGEVAQTWRQLMIQSMFPASQTLGVPDRNDPEKRRESRRTKSRDANRNSDASSTASRVPFPPKFSKPLPVPEQALVGSSDPALKPTAAYAIVGPRIRGKFDGRKAVDLGLPPGPLRARLAQGESVIIQVKDSSGNTVERKIKPEDCIGESVTPAVSSVSCFAWMT